MDISSKRFSVKSDGCGGVTIKDNDAPYHTHVAHHSEVPPVLAMALMKESDFDRVMADLCYNN